MDILTSLNQLITGQQSALLAGLVAAFTPCTLAIMPIILYRFGIGGNKQKAKNTVSLLFLVATFVVSFLIAAILLRDILNGPLVNTSRLLLGFVLIYASFLTWQGRGINSIFNKLASPITIGMALPWAVGLSPCVLPWLALSTLTSTNYMSVILFAIGLIAPAVLLAFFGNTALNSSRKIAQFSNKIEKIAPLLLVLTGVYLMLQLLGPTTIDIAITFAFVAFIYIFQTWSILKVTELRTVYNYVFAAVAGIMLLTIFGLALSSALPAEKALSAVEVRRYCIPGQDVKYREQSIKMTALYFAAGAILGTGLLTQERKSRRLVISRKPEN